jgi:hypothetical protein
MSSEKYYDALSGGNDLTKTGLKNIAASVRQRLLNKWNAFRKKLKGDNVPAKFENIVMQVKNFIGPIASSLSSRKPPPLKWSAPGPWA